MTQQFYAELDDVLLTIREAGYVDSGLSSNRGTTFVYSYRPSAKMKRKGYEGLVEVFFNGERNFREVSYGIEYNGETREGRRDIKADELKQILKF